MAAGVAVGGFANVVSDVEARDNIDSQAAGGDGIPSTGPTRT
jgi:hypothetical protein